MLYSHQKEKNCKMLGDGCVKLMGESFHNADVYQIITLYTLNMLQFFCQFTSINLKNNVISHSFIYVIYKYMFIVGCRY